MLLLEFNSISSYFCVVCLLCWFVYYVDLHIMSVCILYWLSYYVVCIVLSIYSWYARVV